MKGQEAVEWVVILAASLIILFIIISLSSNYLSQLSQTNINTQARNSAEDLAAAAKQVYYEGVGSTESVLITIPEGVNSNKSGVINNHTININVLGSDFPVTTEFVVEGSFPTTPGTYTVWVTAESGYVLIGTMNLSVNPTMLYIHFFSQNFSQSAQSGVNFSNGGNSNLTVNLTLNFPSGAVNASLSNPSDSGFTLTPSSSHQVLLNFSVAANAFGSYSGSVFANDSSGDKLTVGIIVDVTSQVCSNQTQYIPSGQNCTTSYLVIGTYNDSSYSYPKEAFNPSEYVTTSGSGWTAGEQVTVNIIGPGGSVAGYPQPAYVNSTGWVSNQWNTQGAAIGSYTVQVNDSSSTRTSTFNITSCK